MFCGFRALIFFAVFSFFTATIGPTSAPTSSPGPSSSQTQTSTPTKTTTPTPTPTTTRTRSSSSSYRMPPIFIALIVFGIVFIAACAFSIWKMFRGTCCNDCFNQSNDAEVRTVSMVLVLHVFLVLFKLHAHVRWYVRVLVCVLVVLVFVKLNCKTMHTFNLFTFFNLQKEYTSNNPPSSTPERPVQEVPQQHHTALRVT